MALEQENLVEQSSGNTVGAFRASGLTDVDRFLRPKSAPAPVVPLAARNPIVGNYLDRALSGISSYGTPPASRVGKPIVVAANSAADERDANFARFGTNFPTPAQVAAADAEENQPAQKLSPVYQRRLERFAPVNYNASSTI